MKAQALANQIRLGYGDELADMFSGIMNTTIGDLVLGVPMTKAQLMEALNNHAAFALVQIGEDLINESIKCAPILKGRLIESGTVRFRNKIVVGTEKKSTTPETDPTFGGIRYQKDLPHVSGRAVTLYVDVGFNTSYAYWLHEIWTGNLGPRSSKKAAAGIGNEFGGVGKRYIARPLYAKLDTYRNHLKACFPPLSYDLELQIDWHL